MLLSHCQRMILLSNFRLLLNVVLMLGKVICCVDIDKINNKLLGKFLTVRRRKFTKCNWRCDKICTQFDI